MRLKDLILLPLGKYKVTDGITEYELEKSLVGEYADTLGEHVWWLRQKFMYHTMSMGIYLEYAKCHDDMGPIERMRTPMPNFKYPVLKAHVSFGMIGLSAEVTYKIKSYDLLPIGSFKKYAAKEIDCTPIYK